MIEPADLDDGTIGGEGELGAVPIQFPHGFEHGFRTLPMTEPGVTGQAPFADLLMEPDLGIGLGADHLTETVKDHRQRAFGNLAGVQQLEGARRRVAGIGEKGFARLFAGTVEGRKGGLGKINLSAELDDLRQPLDRQG